MSLCNVVLFIDCTLRLFSDSVEISEMRIEIVNIPKRQQSDQNADNIPGIKMGLQRSKSSSIRGGLELAILKKIYASLVK